MKPKDESREHRVDGLLAKMTLREKVRQMSCSYWQAYKLLRYRSWTFDSGLNRRLGIPPVRFTDGPRGEVISPSTCFPVSMARGASFDPALEERVGDAVGIEARARGASFYGGVCINLLRHPGWGRAQETYGEDSHLLGLMGVGLVTGAQRHVMACAKHFACNSIENSRFYVNVKISERALREVYLPHFKACIDAGCASVMSAYNRLNGRYCGHNPDLLTRILKEDWGFDGFVISDFVFGVRDTVPAANAGLDIEYPLPRFYGEKLHRAIVHGDVPMEKIDDSVRRILRQKDRFREIAAKTGYTKDRIACIEHTRLALESAEKGIVLLKNRDQVLPFEPERIGSIAVIGRLANRANLGDTGSSRVKPPYAVSPMEGITKRAGERVKVLYESGRSIKKALAAARAADAVVVMAGTDWLDEGESIFPGIGGDRKNLKLKKHDEHLILSLARENPRTVVVVESGSAIIMENWRDEVAAILMAWYPGMEGGNAIASVLFGDVNPSGKLPLTIPKEEEQLMAFDTKAKEVEYGLYHGYRHFDKLGLTPAFAFGFGLSYTSYHYSNLRLNCDAISPDGAIAVSVDVTNIGERAGEEVAQMYVSCVQSRIERAVKELKGFKRVALDPGETKTVVFTLPASDLASWDDGENPGWFIEEGEYKVMVGPSSLMEDLSLSVCFRING
jgi:beta-glucosidase